ncbi:MAG TPA: ADOP family duplicated permease, partial [Gammaproteobacteria bacterium]
VAVNGDYFSVLRLTPALGRLIGPQDEPRVGEGRVVVLSHDYWQNHFGGDRDVLGRTLTVNGQPLTIIGVAPEGFSGASLASRPQVFVPLTMRWLMEPQVSASADNRLSYWVYLFARLAPGVTMQQAERAINAPYRAIINTVEVPLNAGGSEQYLANFKEKSLVLAPGARGQSRALNDARLPLTLLLAVTLLVLAIACVNIANLLLARGAMRAREMALRSAIGASRAQLVAQLLIEAGMLGLLGCLVALPVAMATLKFISIIMPPDAVASLGMELSPAAILFAVAASLVTVFLFGLFPALAATRVSPGGMLKEQSGQQSGGRTMTNFRRVLATTQITFSMVLLVLAGLFAQSLANVARVDLGLETDSVATFSVAPALNGYAPERSSELFRRIEDELAALPGVVSVASSMVPVISGDSWGGNVSVQGFEAAPDADTNVQYNKVSPHFFQTLQIPLLSGRDFSDADSAGRPEVAIVNQAFAEKFNLGNDVPGKRMAFGAGGELDIEIIGLVADAKYSEVKEEIPPQVFLARYQDEELGYANFYVRGTLAPEDMLASMAHVVEKLAPDLPVNNLSTLPDVISENTFLDRMISMLSGGFALLATLLAAIGLYGLLSYSVAQRTRELGVRQALGATSSQLRALVMRQVGGIAVIGGGLGLLLAVLLGRTAESVLFGVSGCDPIVLAAATLLLGIVVTAAGYLPARRATRVNPIEALRYE